MDVQVRKATADEKDEYGGLYPLAYVAVVNGVTFDVETRKHDVDPEDPQYEIIPPDGCRFVDTEFHTALCLDYRDVVRFLNSEAEVAVEPCPADCNCQEEPTDA